MSEMCFPAETVQTRSAPASSFGPLEKFAMPLSNRIALFSIPGGKKRAVSGPKMLIFAWTW